MSKCFQECISAPRRVPKDEERVNIKKKIPACTKNSYSTPAVRHLIAHTVSIVVAIIWVKRRQEAMAIFLILLFLFFYCKQIWGSS